MRLKTKAVNQILHIARYTASEEFVSGGQRVSIIIEDHSVIKDTPTHLITTKKI